MKCAGCGYSSALEGRTVSESRFLEVLSLV